MGKMMFHYPPRKSPFGSEEGKSHLCADLTFYHVERIIVEGIDKLFVD